MKLIKFTVLATLFLAVFFASIGFNVLIHESAHYATADVYGFHPAMHLGETDMSVASFFSAESDIAYVQYMPDANSRSREALIAAAGPLANLALAGLAFVFYAKSNNQISSLIWLILLTTSFVSFGVNILPISPIDGFYIWQAVL